MTRLLGVILAGGQARRFGGDKALATLAGTALLDHAANALRPVVEEIAVVGRDSPTYVSIADWPAAGLGPLGGLCGALRHARDRHFDAVLSLPCDTPSLPVGLLGDLARRSVASFVADTPVIGLWPCKLADALSDYLDRGGNLAVRVWAKEIGAEAVDGWPPIPNVNRPDDLALLRGMSGP
ncbi:molybdenum cofactor guanylyltransferase [Sphingomonas asaccharolytica]|uniref:molybdenum cofactor guanylyltransferase n=1 Tax=Sphingomonas asaccharolytica TaxID=40681 RepID=UPI0008317C20|nr:molybdenum cofactor guanylyltransferase [Sphingomonas asaccharolytica]